MYAYEQLAKELRERISDKLDAGEDRLPTQEQLCREFNMSRVTVRRALAILEKEGYIKNVQGNGSILTGRSPRRQQNQICLLLSDPDSYIMPFLVSSLRDAAIREQFAVALCRTDGDFQKERDLLSGLLSQKVLPRGILAEDPYPLVSPNEDLYRALSERGCRVAFLYGKDPSLSFAGCLRADNAQAIRAAIARLVSLGHTNLACIFTMADRTGIESCAVYLESLRNAHISLTRDRLLLLGDMDSEEIVRTGGSAVFESFLQSVSHSCTALVCGNDLWAYAAASLLEHKGLKIPQDLSLISLRTSYLRRRSTLQIDSFALASDPGQAIMQLLLHGMNETFAPTITLPLRYLPGNSLLQIT